VIDRQSEGKKNGKTPMRITSCHQSIVIKRGWGTAIAIPALRWNGMKIGISAAKPIRYEVSKVPPRPSFPQ
jgi:hypothetical protein